MALDPISGPQQVSANRPAAAPRQAVPASGGPSFADLLQQKTQQAGGQQSSGGGVQLSRHAQKRVDRRDLNLDPARMDRLESAITRAAEKGSKNSVVMLDDLAVVVDVRQRTVVTAMQRNSQAEGGRERVFTNIDSVVIA